MATDNDDDSIQTTLASDQHSISSTVRERMIAKLSKKQQTGQLSMIRDQTQMTRFDDPHSLPPSSPHPPHTTHTSQDRGRGTSSLRWKMLSDRLPEAIERTGEEESYLFFTGTVDDIQLPQTAHDERDIASTPDHELHEESPGEEGVNSITNDGSHGNRDDDVEANDDENEQTSLGGQSSHQLLHPPTTVYIPQQVRLEREETILFTPSSISAIEDEIGQPRRYHDDDDGLYVGRRPKVKWTNHVIVKNRLHHRQDEGRGWFDHDGLIKSLPDPLDHTPSLRPAILTYDPTRNIHTPPVKKVVMNTKIIPSLTDKGYRLGLTLSSLHFTHHPLFSLEHVTSHHLRDMCSNYTSHITDNTYNQYILHKLYALKSAVLDLKNSLQHIIEDEGGSSEGVEMEMTLRRYLRDILSLRRERREREASNYKLIHNILRMWSSLKSIRESQEYSTTSLLISFKRQVVDYNEEQCLRQREIVEEVEEERELFELELSEREAVYQTKLAQWMRIREGGRDGGREGERQEENNTEQQSGMETASQPSLRPMSPSLEGYHENFPRPTPPPPFNQDQYHQELIDYYQHHLRPVGEPILIPLVWNTNTISQNPPRSEQLRRMEVSRSKIKIKIFYNDNEVCTTSECYLSQEFTVCFNESLHVEIVQWPETIKLQVLECFLFSTSLLAEIYVPIPDSKQSCRHSIPVSYHFSSDRVSRPVHNAVGSGVSILDSGILLTSGEIKVCVGWEEDSDGRIMCPPGLGVVETHITHMTNLLSLKKWAEETRLDPNDPRNTKFLQLLQSVPTISDENVFRLHQIDDRERLVSDGEFDNDRRFALLEHRHHGHPLLKNKSIAMNKENITISQWKAVQEYQPYKDYELPPTYQGDFHGNRREERNRFLLQVREQVLSHIRSGRTTLHIDDIIHYDIIPSISGLKATMLELISPRRPLKPKRKPARKARAQNEQISKAVIVVRIVRAFGLPIRNHSNNNNNNQQQSGGRSISVITSPQSPLHHSNEESTPPINEGLLTPYVEITMCDYHLRTTTVTGSNPYWNEELNLPFHPPYNDYSPTALAKITDSIHFNVFDEFTIDLLQDDRERDTNIHQRKEKKWIGSFTLPFSTLHTRTRIEGTFVLDVPKLLLGYSSGHGHAHQSSDHAHLQLFISLEPPLSTLPPIRDLFSSSEEPHLLRRSKQWLKNLQNAHPNRQYIELLAHYVSLIPFLPDAITFSGDCDIWTTSEQFLHMLAGDEEEHAILLTNYFLHCGWQAWLVLGNGIPEGPTAYVLTKAPNVDDRVVRYWLWNASTGRHFTQYDPHCPLTSVGCIINKYNVWGNIQEYSNPGRIEFDLNNNKHWSPLFNVTMETLDTVQRELVYDVTDEVKVHDLQDSIEREIRDHVMSLRSRFITRWNNNCGRLLHKMLIRYEDHLADGQTFKDTSELDNIMTTYNLSGSPLHFSYTDILHIVSVIERTGLHLTEDRRVELGLAVYVHPYPNDVISVWVFLVTMIPK